MNAAARAVNQGVLSKSFIVSLLFTRMQVTMYALLLVLLLSALGIIYTTQETRTLQAGLEKVRVDRDRLHVQWSQLLLEQGTWAMQARIERIAEKQLEMVLPDQKSVVIIP